MIHFTLPLYPLSLSQCFVNSTLGKRGKSIRIDSREYKAWKQETDLHIATKVTHAFFGRHSKLLNGEVAVSFLVRRKDRRQRDLDNMLKCLGDTLTRNAILIDDSQIVDLRIRYYPIYPTLPPVTVEIGEPGH